MRDNLFKEITTIMIVKLAVLFAIWWVFFSEGHEIVNLSDVLLPK